RRGAVDERLSQLYRSMESKIQDSVKARLAQQTLDREFRNLFQAPVKLNGPAGNFKERFEGVLVPHAPLLPVRDMPTTTVVLQPGVNVFAPPYDAAFSGQLIGPAFSETDKDTGSIWAAYPAQGFWDKEYDGTWHADASIVIGFEFDIPGQFAVV